MTETVIGSLYLWARVAGARFPKENTKGPESPGLLKAAQTHGPVGLDRPLGPDIDA